MSSRSLLALGAAALTLSFAATAARADVETDTAALFSAWAGSDGPGCAVSVVRDGRTAFQAAYGQANVEAGTANTARTAFQIGSVSKQFTAFAVHLLAAEGKLSLQDDVRKHVPEMHAFDRPVTVDQLLHHTSGLRDEWMVLLQGRRPEDAVTQHDTLRALFAQRELNFEPGSRFVYSNSNYTLLALVVERASGQSFPAFMKARVFEPLGMATPGCRTTGAPCGRRRPKAMVPGRTGWNGACFRCPPMARAISTAARRTWPAGPRT